MREYLENASCDWSKDSKRLIYTASQLCKKTFFYIQEAGYFKTKWPYFTERENLDSYLLIYTLSGKGNLIIDGKCYSIEPNKFVYIYCMPHHYYACEKDFEWEFLWLHFNGIAARGYYEEFTRSGSPVMSLMNSDKMTDSFRQILTVIEEKSRNRDILISNVITDILTMLLTSDENIANQELAGPDYIKDTIQFLDKHFQEDMNLDTIAKIIGISKYYLLKQFKRYTGTTLHEYLIINRLNYAKEMLKYTNDPVNEIAYACGMNHVSHFINLFQKHEHMTPLQYRKEWS